MQASDFQAETETKADTINLAPSGSITTIKALECPFRQVGRDVVTGIFYAEHEVILLVYQRKSYPPLLGIVFGSIRAKI